MRIVIRGIVQGVGFRPTVYRVAASLGLNGHVLNNGSEVVIEVDGDANEFIAQLKEHLPPLARIDSLDIIDEVAAEPLEKGFRILPSQTGAKGVSIPNDVAICGPCRNEMFDPLEPSISLSIHQLHGLWGAFLHHRRPAIRPRKDLDAVASPCARTAVGSTKERRTGASITRPFPVRCAGRSTILWTGAERGWKANLFPISPLSSMRRHRGEQELGRHAPLLHPRHPP